MVQRTRPKPSNEPLPTQIEVLQGPGVSGNSGVVTASGASYGNGRKAIRMRGAEEKDDRKQIAQPWQVEAYRQTNICGEARYAATLFASMAARADIGVVDGQVRAGSSAQWETAGPEVEALAEFASTVRERRRLIRDYMLHRTIAGECYLIARDRRPTDYGYTPEPDAATVQERVNAMFEDDPEGDDPLDEDLLDESDINPPVWEIVAVTEMGRHGKTWQVRHDNNEWINLAADQPVIRMWNPDPSNRREAWSPFKSMASTLREIEYLTKHIFTQVRSRLMAAGVWFVPENITFPPPPPSAVEGGEEAIAAMNEAERFMVAMAASSMEMLEADEVAFPTVVFADAAALEQVDQSKLIKFWSDLDDKAMIMRSDAVRRFSLGMDLPPEQVLGSSGLAVTGAGGSAGSVNHWGVWANEEQTISAHIEPALDDFVAVLTTAILYATVPGTTKVIGYNTATLRLRQDRSKEALELYDRGLLNGKTTLREVGFDPDNDMMGEDEHRKWLLNRLVSGSPSPEQMQAAFMLLTGEKLPVETFIKDGAGSETRSDGGENSPKGVPGRDKPRSLADHPVQGPPQGDHEHKPAPFGVRTGRKVG